MSRFPWPQLHLNGCRWTRKVNGHWAESAWCVRLCYDDNLSFSFYFCCCWCFSTFWISCKESVHGKRSRSMLAGALLEICSNIWRFTAKLFLSAWFLASAHMESLHVWRMHMQDDLQCVPMQSCLDNEDCYVDQAACQQGVFSHNVDCWVTQLQPCIWLHLSLCFECLFIFHE